MQKANRRIYRRETRARGAIPIDDWSTKLAVEDVQKTLQVMKEEGVLKKDLNAKEMIHNVVQ